VGRRRLRSLEDAENDLRDLKVKRWRQESNTTETWTCVVKEAKVVRGL
jgi:hypothetical protein